jgi:hypothetical protein
MTMIGPAKAKEKRGSGCLGFLSGVFLGWVCLLPLGIFFTGTGVCAVFGIPMILLGLFLPFSMAGMGAMRYLVGFCPYCSTQNKVLKHLPGFNCAGCSNRLLVRNKEFYPSEVYIDAHR